MTAPQANSAFYEVGYGKPPRHTQFKSGQSGNPGGRPRGQRSDRLQKLALHEAYRTVVVKEEGRAVPLSAIQAVLRSHIEMAAHGNVRAQCAILAMIRDAERADAANARLAALYEPANDEDDDINDDINDDIDNAIDDGVADDSGVEPAPQADEIGMDVDVHQEEGELAAAPPPSAEIASADSAPSRENAAALLAGTQPPAAGAPVRDRVRMEAAATDAPPSDRRRPPYPFKKSRRDARGSGPSTGSSAELGRTAAVRAAPSPALPASGTPALLPLLLGRPLREEEKIENSL